MELTKAARDTVNLAKDVTKYLERLEADDQLREEMKGLTFTPGRKLFLELEVTERDMTRFLMTWLYSKDEDKKELEYMGCKLYTIHFSNPLDDFKQELKEFINK